ncbi:MAG: TonB-dependent receptor [Epsilonproteobacteria bacterium]|nr:TonB-dependent receptor [Campylobacterota bacterium]
MRGNKSFVRDKIKLMIDGISINTELAGSSYFYLDMPIESIQRIEVIRGPASALYGSYAHIGVINVITKASAHKENILFTNVSTVGNHNIGFTQNVNANGIKLALDGFFVKNDNSREYNSYSLLPMQNSFTSYEDFTNKSLGITLQFAKELSLTSRWLEKNTQNFYGYGAWPIVQDPKNLQNTSFINELRYTPKISKNSSIDAKIGYKQYKYTGKSRLRPLSLLGQAYDLIGNGYYKEYVVYADAALKYQNKVHNALFGLFLSQAKANDTKYFVNDPSVSEDTDIELPNNGLKNNLTRREYALYFNDIYTFSTHFTGNIGLRYDNYNDAESSLAPKLSLLYTADETQSYKLMYQRSFRVPSWVELYGSTSQFQGNSSLQSETIDTLELAYTYEAAFDKWLRVNIFYSDMKNFIYRDAAYVMHNADTQYSYGAEFEEKTPLNQQLTLQANYSYMQMRTKEHTDVPFVANHLANAMLYYQITSKWHTASKLRYVGDRKREAGDSRSALHGYTMFDQTLSFTQGVFCIQASAKNIFDADVAFPSQLGNESYSGTGTYLDDFHRDGRSFWLSLEWSMR